MNLASDIDRELDRIQSAGAGQFHLPAPSGTLRADLSSVDRIGCEFDELSLESPALQGADTRRLEKIASKLAAKLTYLLEPLRILEIDDQARVVQMRSVPPSRQGNLRSYYEVQVREGGAVALRRFEAERGKPRRQVAAHVTREVFRRLADDLAESIGTT